MTIASFLRKWAIREQRRANQQMSWSPRSHRMLLVRTAIANGSLATDHAAAQARARRPFRPAAQALPKSGAASSRATFHSKWN